MNLGTNLGLHSYRTILINSGALVTETKEKKNLELFVQNSCQGIQSYKW